MFEVRRRRARCAETLVRKGPIPHAPTEHQPSAPPGNSLRRGRVVTAEFSGATLPLVWGLPFAGLLLSIAFVPLVAPRFWHAHYGKVALFWVLALLVPFAAAFGAREATRGVAHAILEEFVPFVVILFSLFTIAGGI